MIIYEVNHEVAREVEKEYSKWLSSHVQQMLTFDGFESVDWYTREGEDNEQTVHWSLHYHVQSITHLITYQETYAEKMRAEGADRFGNRYQTNRRILTLYRHFD